MLCLARCLETRTIERNRVHLLSLGCGTLEANTNLRKMLVVICCAVEVNLCADEGLDDGLDFGLGVVGRLARNDAILAKSCGEIITLHDIHSSVPVVKIAIGSIVDSGSASTVLLSLIKNKLATLQSRPHSVKLLLKVGVGMDGVENVLTSVGASAARGVGLSFIIGPHTVHGEAGGIGVNTGRKAAATVVTERARP